ncbi:MAG: DNA recombination and repair protein RecO [uncultured Sphingomonadaceae bacterium]|uniref:DNA repair protein RecO n=1 Tax=uncultured Sphingomonadaceae bacterium TaxID=169976 RepID=A0A6J4TA19_9SPHN|nr:MAG: DNA recombination and repair protein RecO [uncultured Sphingomonadaceae bacterium]
MDLSTEALVLSLRQHGEHGAIARALTAERGVLTGYVRGGRSRRLRPVLIPGNHVLGRWRARTDEQLPALTLELLHSRAPMLGEPLAAGAIEWATALTAAALPEGQPYPRLHAALAGVLDAIEAAPSARGWAGALARYELLLLSELGYGLQLDRCAVTDRANDLAYVSPRSGRAVSAAGAGEYKERLFPLPPFLREGGPAGWDDALAALRITGHFLLRDIAVDRTADLFAARERLVDRLERAAG